MVKTLTPEHKEKLRLGRERAKNAKATQQEDELAPVAPQIKEVIKYVPEPRLEGFALYKKLKDKGYYQGGSEGQWIEDPNGTEKVYVPSPSEMYTYFIGDPSEWEKLRDAIIRAYIELR